MIGKLFRHTMMMFLALMVPGTLTCCVDDNNVTDSSQELTEDYAIAFDISLGTNPGSSMRAISDNHKPDEKGDAVDYQVDIEGVNNDFRILLFDKDDNFLFEPLKVHYQYQLNELDDETYSGQKRWQIIIPAHVLKSKGLLDKIKQDNFKIAVLANWPKDKRVEFQEGEKLQKLSHYYYDDVYGIASNDDAYGHLPDNRNMGAFTEWVKSNYSNQNAAEVAIRTDMEERTDPRMITRKLGRYDHTYEHIWRVWHFGDFGDEINELSTNSQIIELWKKQFTKDQEKFSEITTITSGFTGYGGYNDKEDYNGLTFENPTQNDNSYSPEGFTVGMGLTNAENEAKTQYITNNRIKFSALAAGTLRVWAKKATTSEKCILGIQVKDNNATNNTTNRKVKAQLTDEFQVYIIDKVDVTGAGSSVENAPLTIPEVISIYAVDGSMIIKQIEYIETKHLSDSDREGYLPGENNGQLIPMYGVQEFEAIGNHLAEGEIFNLSTAPTEGDDGYTRKKIHLLRSVAKVELLIPVGFPKLSHAYMRCVNRHGRCEPIDVLTPTDILWKGGTTYRSKTYQGIDQEIENIKTYGPFYKKDDQDKSHYRGKLSWFYTTWAEDWTDKWNWNGKNPEVPTTPDYPHIFNTRINRSDYMHFRFIETKNGYDRYVLYVPEKNIDDPGDIGNLSKTPKIPHIELRFEGFNNEENLDDNDCYRIYFTDKNNTDIVSKGYVYDDQEKKYLNDNILYPIVRNHIYRFTVTSVSGFELTSLNVNVDVVPYDEIELNPEFGDDDSIVNDADSSTDVDDYDDTELNPGFGKKNN